MRFAIISDIHGNLQALEAVLARIDALGADSLVCLGDVVGYGADPAACIEIVRDRCSHVIMGNHDAAVTGLTSMEYFNSAARASALWTGEVLSGEDLRWLAGLPWEASLQDFVIVHSTPDKPENWRYLMSESQARELYDFFGGPLLFYGHTHYPMAFERLNGEVLWRGRQGFPLEDGGRYIVNVGSVGQPRDGDPRAAFGFYDSGARAIEFHRQEYDIAGARKAILDAGLPATLAERLAHGR